MYAWRGVHTELLPLCVENRETRANNQQGDDQTWKSGAGKIISSSTGDVSIKSHHGGCAADHLACTTL